MADQDLPQLDDTIVQLPSDIRADLAERGRKDLYFFDKAILGMRDMTVECHGPLCAYHDLNPKQFKLYLMPRDHLKTSVVTIGANVQRIIQNPEHRILIANESATNAGRMLRSIRQHAEGNRVFRALYSDRIHKDTRKVRWNDAELDFVREGHYPEPTIDSIGMTGAVTSRHYTHICYDDPISEEAVKSEKVMADTISRMSAALSLLVNPSTDTIDLIGTRWALFDVYSEWKKNFGEQLGIFARAAIEDGEPIWPERFSLDILAMKRQQMGEYKFSCLMMNNPRNRELQNLNVEDLRYWEWGSQDEIIMYNKDGSELRRVFLEQLDITCTVDPASAEKISNDRNAVVTVGVTPWNEAIVLEAWGKRCDAMEVIEYLFKIKERYHPRVFGIEDIGYQKVLKVFLRQFANERMVYFNIEPLPTGRKSKPTRVRGLQPYMATSRIFIRGNQHILRNELSEFPLGQHDDVIDALSMHIMLWRGQMSPEARNKYKEEEAKLIRRIIRQQSSPGHRPVVMNPMLLDPEEWPDEFDRPQLPIRETIMS